MVTWRFYLKVLVHGRRLVRRFWLSNSGKWHWLAEKPARIAALNRILWRESVPSLSFLVMLSLSGLISTLGLLSGSTATVIGAMIIAPLMGPIIGMAYSLAIANRRLLKRASATLFLGIVVTVVTAILITWMARVRTVNPEILARAEPTLIDLGVALGAGAAGAFAKSRKHVADAFPGVAIAVALVPPLSVVGIGLALNMSEIWSGATLLFVTNLIAVIFSGIAVFLWQRYGSIERAQGGLTLSLVMLIVLGVPLGLSLNKFLVESNVRQQVSALMRTQTSTFENADIQELRVTGQRRMLRVDVSVAAEPDTIREEQIRQVRRLLEAELKQPVVLNVRIVPMQQFESRPES